ncbi:trypsin-like serine protease [Bradyrhizobium sp. CCGB12]|uniref:trypsin-like serine peptidase n=1 Tax=Bradyrhizobium sp. CCGB12 TaxID=2949632 RepID=UPI0020B1C1C6|nr:trypsin-like serine protease [Bradyrhizobium sp. CCGB12]MCP3395313.1 trypsin-like serine protease [Bradyrhizobium sp. CCGB12]
MMFRTGMTSLLLWTVTAAAHAQTGPVGPVSTSIEQSGGKISYATARPRPLPIAQGYTDADARKALQGSDPQEQRIPGLQAGAIGTGKPSTPGLRSPVSKARESLPEAPAQVDFGTSGLPFSTARADLKPNATNDQYPYSAAGKLFFNESGESYICSASLIKPGLVITAAHCVAKFGSNQYYSDWEFHPGYRDGISPFGKWTVKKAYVLKSYLDGSDSCKVAGVVCKNDIAVLVLVAQRNSYPGKRTGWFAFAWNGGGFTPQRITHLTQLGYPACLDNAGYMQRNDSQGAVDSANSDNTIVGSLMCGGSSGGPWIMNFGVQPALTGTQFGSAPTPNTIIGVTSWGSTNNAVKWMGASPFVAENVKKLVDAACNDYAPACLEN